MFAAFTLIASYWYRRAYEAHDNGWNYDVELTPRETHALARAKYYDCLARAALPEERTARETETQRYHDMYFLWHELGLTFEALVMVCHFCGIELR